MNSNKLKVAVNGPALRLLRETAAKIRSGGSHLRLTEGVSGAKIICTVVGDSASVSAVRAAIEACVAPAQSAPAETRTDPFANTPYLGAREIPFWNTSWKLVVLEMREPVKAPGLFVGYRRICILRNATNGMWEIWLTNERDDGFVSSGEYRTLMYATRIEDFEASMRGLVGEAFSMDGLMAVLDVAGIRAAPAAEKTPVFEMIS
ncbi:hypothetical protein [Falsiroseomonas sp. CW058]|uniref:hypothetical protein n=1 Tax=Falsiroseomonas sp. CW058 TaxID=3388664 RepID=UPI003D322DC0